MWPPTRQQLGWSKHHIEGVCSILLEIERSKAENDTGAALALATPWSRGCLPFCPRDRPAQGLLLRAVCSAAKNWHLGNRY